MSSSGIKVAVAAAIATGSIFAAAGGLFDGYNAHTVCFLFLFGLLIGAMAAPELAPKAFRYPTMWQVTTCALACTAGAICFRAPPEGVALAALVGVVLGYLAPYWIKHVQIP